MARLFTTGSNDYLVTGTVNAFSLRTWSSMVYVTTYSTGIGRICDWRAAGGSNMTMQLYAPSGSNVFEVNQNFSTNAGTWTCPAPTINEWHVVTMTFDGGSSSNNPLMYVDGVSQTVTETIAPSGTINANNVSVTIGQRFGGSGNKYDGYAAEMAMWNRILTADEIAGLGKFISPAYYQRGLVWHYPMIGAYSPERNYAPGASGGDATVTGTSVVAHPRVFYPPPYRSFVPPTVVTGWGPLRGMSRNRLVVAA